ncbi:response regulator [Calidifontibacillus erzurumensis]|uniref:response regulator n=1 Tax=Calidifontibacillus erzurumensis TaxID=2741433 RepID=UPI002E7739C8|nr:response regulator [Calidifontibacillus erzurumensis]
MIKVVLIEDDPMVQEVNRQFIEKVDGFKIVGIASNGKEGLDLIKKHKPELVFVDIYMPAFDGLSLIHQIRKEGLSVDIIAITAASDMETIRDVLQNGAFDYIMKPFKFERIKKALENYRSFRKQLESKKTLTQKDLDQIRFEKEVYESSNLDLPKGLNEVTFKKIITYLNDQTEPLSAEEVAEQVGLARVTARRYLDYMVKSGHIDMKIQYGSIGRPINRYITKGK